MPTYLYECVNGECPSSGRFTQYQSMKDEALARCPHCGGPVERLVAPAYVSAPTGDTDLKSKGFAKLVRRDKGVYENVTALDHESRFWDANQPETFPDLKTRISD